MKGVLSYARRAFSSKFKATLTYGEYKVTPAREVPKDIPRPGYIEDPQYPGYNLSKDPVVIHTPETCKKIAAAGKVVARAVKNAIVAAKEGVTTDKLDEIVHNTIIQANAYPSPIGYHRFPKSVCISVNEVLVHGIPDLRPLQNGDYLNVDVTCYLNGVHGDSSAMTIIDDVHPDILKLVGLLLKNRYLILRKLYMKL
jgi:methionyl aminopeptidase